MINMPTTDIMTLTTGEAVVPANNERGDATDVSFHSVITAKETGPDPRFDGFERLQDTGALRLDETAEPVGNQAVFSPDYTPSNPALLSWAGQLATPLPIVAPNSPEPKPEITPAPVADANSDPSVIAQNTSDTPRIDSAMVLLANSAAYRGNPTARSENPVLPVETKRGSVSLLKNAPDTPIQPDAGVVKIQTEPKNLQQITTPVRAATVDGAVPYISTAIINEADVTTANAFLPRMPAGVADEQNIPVDTRLKGATTPDGPPAILPVSTQGNAAIILPMGDRPTLAAAGPAPGAVDRAQPANAIPVQTLNPASFTAQLPIAGPPENHTASSISAQDSVTPDKTAASQPEQAAVRLSPLQISQPSQQTSTSPDFVSRGQTPAQDIPNQPQRVDVTSLQPGVPPQAAVQDMTNQLKQSQVPSPDAASIQQPTPVATPVQPAVLSPQPSLRQVSDGKNPTPKVAPTASAEPRLETQNSTLQRPPSAEAVQIAPATEITPLEPIESLSTPEIVQLEMRSADSTTILRHDTNINRPEVMRHVAQQLVDVARKMPDRPVELALNPEELGRVRLTFTTTEAGLHVSVMAERGETMDLLRRHIDSLAQDFRDLGYRDVKFDFSGNGARSDAKTSGNESGDRDQNANPDAMPHDIEAPIQLSLEPSTGLDLRL